MLSGNLYPLLFGSSKLPAPTSTIHALMELYLLGTYQTGKYYVNPGGCNDSAILTCGDGRSDWYLGSESEMNYM